MNRKMLQKCTVVVLLLAFAVGSSSFPTWEEYLEEFPDKKARYEQIDGELERRQARYEERVASFADITGYEPAVNKFTDWYEDELKGLSTLQEIPVTSRAPSQEKPLLARNKVGNPSSFDWRDRDVITSIKDQGSCGSCWTFASAAYAESRLILAGDYSKNNIDLSEQYLLECTDYSSCSGGYMEYVMESVKECPKESTYPYNPYVTYSGICSSSGVRTGYENYDYYSLTDEEIIPMLLKEPLAISIASSGWSSYGSGVFSCGVGDPVDHAVLLVGYTDTYWIVKNQWGSSWGENGYIRIARGSQDCQIGASVHVLGQGLLSYSPLLLLAVVLAMMLF